ncbi:MAG: hypothetical protein ACXWPM_01105 [Bdellovibrionota bacterium]
MSEEIARLRANDACRGVHTCHDKCTNWICLMRKERDALLEERTAKLAQYNEGLRKLNEKIAKLQKELEVSAENYSKLVQERAGLTKVAESARQVIYAAQPVQFEIHGPLMARLTDLSYMLFEKGGPFPKSKEGKSE